MNNRVGVVGIFVHSKENIVKVNAVLSDYGEIITGRMGIPFNDQEGAVIALIVKGTTDEIGAMTGKLGTLRGISVKTALSR